MVLQTDLTATGTVEPVSKSKLIRSILGGLLTALPVLVIGTSFLVLAPNFYILLALSAVVNLMIVVGLQIYMGNAGIPHFGHTAFVGMGAYGVAVLATPVAMKTMSIPNAPFGLGEIALHPMLAAVAALAIVGLIALATGRIIARLSGVAATIVSLACLVITHSIFLNWSDLFKGNQAFFGIPRIAGLGTLMAFATLVIVGARVFKDSDWGLQLRASAQSPQAAAALGIPARRLRMIAWVISALVCGLAGVLYAYYAGTISPKLFYFQQVFMTLAMLILGGMGTVTGAVAGVLLLSVGLEAIRSLESGVVIAGVQMPQLLGLSGISLGVVIVLCMSFRPDGIVGRYELDELVGRVFTKWKSRRSM